MDPSTIPAGVPPPGVTPNFENPDSLNDISLGLISTLIALSVLGSAIRVFTKVRIMRQFDYEDSLAWFLAYSGLILRPEFRGYDHMWERYFASIPEFLYMSYVSSILFCLSILFAKCAVLLQLQRVFAVKRWSDVWWAVKIVITLSTIFYIIATFLMIFLCWPTVKIWNPTVPSHCISSLPLAGVVSASVNIALNCGILAIPILGLRTLKVQFRQKVNVAVMFSISLVSLGASVGRVYMAHRLMSSADMTRDAAGQAFLAAVELCFFILATVFPTMPRFWQWCRGRDPTQRIPDRSTYPTAGTATARKASLAGHTVVIPLETV